MKKDLPGKSFFAAVEQMAQLLRSEVKLKDRKVRALPSAPLSPSFSNALEQVARLLRSKAHGKKGSKKTASKKVKKKT